MVDQMDEDGEVQRLWTDFHQTIRTVREMKVCFLSLGDELELRGVANDSECRTFVSSETSPVGMLFFGFYGYTSLLT